MPLVTCGADGSTNAEVVEQINNNTTENVFNVNSMTDLLLVDFTIYKTVNIRGYHIANDGGGGLFNYDATQSAVNNGGTVINGWVRQYDGLLDYNWFGLSAFEFFVSTTGLDTNNGFSSSTPFLTIQKAIDTYATFRREIGEDCTIHLADGTYTEGGVVGAIKSDSEIIISGASKAGTIVDGTTALLPMGLNFNNCGNARVKNLTVKNFGGVGSGIIFQNGTSGVVDTCKCDSNAEANFNCSGESVMYIIGATESVGTTKYGYRYYGHSRGSLGDDVNTYSADGASSANIQVRDNSRIVCRDGLVLKNSNSVQNSAGLYILKNSYAELRATTIENNSVGIYAESNSIFDNQLGIITFTSNTEDKRIVDLSTDRSLFNSSNLIPYYLMPYSNPTGLGASTNYSMVIDINAATGLQFLTNGNNVNIDFDKSSRISHVASDNTLRLTANGAEYRYSSSGFYSAGNNLGQSFAAWSNVYATTYYSGTSAGVSGTFPNPTSITVTGGIITAIS